MILVSAIENSPVDALENYKYCVKLALDGKGKLDYLTGDIVQPESKWILIWCLEWFGIRVLVKKKTKLKGKAKWWKTIYFKC